MGFFGKIFTWWDGATVGTMLNSAMTGEQVGTDAQGNTYYRGEEALSQGPSLCRARAPLGDLQRRQRCQPRAGRMAWLAARVLRRRARKPTCRRRESGKPITPPTPPARPLAYRPPRSSGGLKRADGDYEAWTPDA
jgi:NADH:ubiquinone oxidoreductase subunit